MLIAKVMHIDPDWNLTLVPCVRLSLLLLLLFICASK